MNDFYVDYNRHNAQEIIEHEMCHTLNVAHDEKDPNDLMYPKHNKDEAIGYNAETRQSLFDATK